MRLDNELKKTKWFFYICLLLFFSIFRQFRGLRSRTLLLLIH